MNGRRNNSTRSDTVPMVYNNLISNIYTGIIDGLDLLHKQEAPTGKGEARPIIQGSVHSSVHIHIAPYSNLIWGVGKRVNEKLNMVVYRCCHIISGILRNLCALHLKKTNTNKKVMEKICASRREGLVSGRDIQGGGIRTPIPVQQGNPFKIQPVFAAERHTLRLS